MVGQAQRRAVNALLTWRPEIAKIPLARDTHGHSRETAGRDTQDVAVEVEAVDETDSVYAQVPDEPPDRGQEARRLQGPSAATPRTHSRRLEPRPQGPLGAEAADVDIPPRPIKPAGDLHELSLRPAGA